MPIPRSAIVQLAEIVLEGGARQAVKYISERETVKLTRRFKARKNERNVDCVLTFGRPNYAEREFIKKCKLAGEPFPVKKIQIKWWPERKKKAA